MEQVGALCHVQHPLVPTGMAPGWEQNRLARFGWHHFQLKQTGPTVKPNWCEASPLWKTARSRRGSSHSSSVLNWKMVSVMEDSLSS